MKQGPIIFKDTTPDPAMAAAQEMIETFNFAHSYGGNAENYQNEKRHAADEIAAIIRRHYEQIEHLLAEASASNASLSAECQAMREERDKLAAKVARIQAAVKSLGEIKDGLTYFERSPIKDAECHARWVELNKALFSEPNTNKE